MLLTFQTSSVKKSRDEFADVRQALDSIVQSQGVWRDLLHQISTSIEGATGRKQAKTIGELAKIKTKTGEQAISDWQNFQLGISEEALYKADDELIGRILKSMSNQPFTAISQKEGGTQLHMIFIFFRNKTLQFFSGKSLHQMSTYLKSFLNLLTFSWIFF